jgi:hypothetical protein
VIVDIDSGVDFNHPSLAGHWWANPGEIPNDGIDNDGNGFVDDTRGWDFYDGDNNPDDQVGHGTQTSGIMGASAWTYPTDLGGDGKMYEGIAPGAKILPLKISTPAQASPEFDQHVGQALDYVLWLVQHHPEYHIVAVNLSLAAYSDATFAQYEQAQVEQLHDLGVFVAASAGNSGLANQVFYPANDPKVFAIAGVNPDGVLTAHTNRGPKVALLAPGNQVPILQMGSTYLTSGDGTSYAAPYVTAAAALIKQVDPQLTPDGIMSVLQRSGVDTFDAESGLTYKRLDLAAAIALAYKELPAPTPYFGSVPSITDYVSSEYYDNGGEGIAYHDSDFVNVPGRIRADQAVDIEKCAEKTFDVTDTRPGEWIAYTVNVPRTGTYVLQARVAAKYGGTFHVKVGSLKVSGTMQIPRTGGWQVYTTLSGPPVVLSDGQHVVRFYMDTAGKSGVIGNFNWFRFVQQTTRSTATKSAVRATTAPTMPAVKKLTFAVATSRTWLATGD